MSEPRRLWIQGPAGKLEAVLRIAADPRAAAVVSHPHPLHGGSLNNAVVFHAERELHRAGWTTLRFNFRGVDGSSGEHDAGQGEVEDLKKAVAWLRGVSHGVPLVSIGYSFGSWCALRESLNDRSVAALVAIGLPVRQYDMASVFSALRKPLAVVQGTEDEFGSIEEVWRLLDLVAPRPKLVEVAGATHLFPDRAREVGALVRDAAEGLLRTLRS